MFVRVFVRVQVCVGQTVCPVRGGSQGNEPLDEVLRWLSSEVKLSLACLQS